MCELPEHSREREDVYFTNSHLNTTQTINVFVYHRVWKCGAELLMSSTDTTEAEVLNLNVEGILFLMFKLGPTMHSGDVGHEDAAFS